MDLPIGLIRVMRLSWDGNLVQMQQEEQTLKFEFKVRLKCYELEIREEGEFGRSLLLQCLKLVSEHRIEFDPRAIQTGISEAGLFESSRCQIHEDVNYPIP